MITRYIYLNYYNFFFTFIAMYKNEWKKCKFWRQKNQKNKFYKNEKVIKIDGIDVNKILVSKEEAYGTKNLSKYFIGYNDNDVIRPLCVRLPQMTCYVKKFDYTVRMAFKINDKQLLKKYNQIWKKVWWWW